MRVPNCHQAATAGPKGGSPSSGLGANTERAFKHSLTQRIRSEAARAHAEKQAYHQDRARLLGDEIWGVRRERFWRAHEAHGSEPSVAKAERED